MLPIVSHYTFVALNKKKMNLTINHQNIIVGQEIFLTVRIVKGKKSLFITYNEYFSWSSEKNKKKINLLHPKPNV